MEMAYIAGLLDGEGSIMLLRPGRGRPRRPEIQIAMAEPEPVQALHNEVGGFLQIKSRTAQADMHYWILKGRPAIELLRALLPFLVIARRRKLAQMLIEGYEFMEWAPGRKPPASERVRRYDTLQRRMQEVNAVRMAPAAAEDCAPSGSDNAYLAGVLDGEGYVSADNRVAEVWSTDPELPAWIKSRYGGGFYVGKSARGNCRASWRWVRAATDFQQADNVAQHMLITRKRIEMQRLARFPGRQALL